MMHCLGYVHRDLSASNILLVKGGLRIVAKLLDLEYAKFYSETFSHDVRTVRDPFLSLYCDNLTDSSSERVMISFCLSKWK